MVAQDGAPIGAHDQRPLDEASVVGWGVLIGLICAFLAALFYGVGSILQAVAANRTVDTGGSQAGLLIRMVKQLPYLLGITLDAIGFLISLVGLHFLPLFVVEAVLASSVGVTAILAVRFLGVKLKQLEKAALVALMFGLILLAISAKSESARGLTSNEKWIMLAGIVLTLVLAGLSFLLPAGKVGVGLAVVAGLGFSGVGVAARTFELPDPIFSALGMQDFWAMVLYGVIGMGAFALALQRTSVTTATALAFGIESILPAFIGIAFLGDRSRPGWGWVAALGFVITVASSTALAGQAEPHVAADPAEQDPAEPSLA